MNDLSCRVASVSDLAAWKEELLALNPWAQNLQINSDNENVIEARRAETLARHSGGREQWNVWAGAMIELEARLHSAGAWEQQETDTEEKRLWKQMAEADFDAHLFEHDTDFE